MEKHFYTMIISYLLPLLTGAVVAFVPYYHSLFTMFSIVILIILILMPILLSLRFSRKKQKAYILTLTYQLYAFTFFFTFPLLKIVDGHFLIQASLCAFFFSCFYSGRWDQRRKIPIVFPGTDKPITTAAIVYYSIIIILSFLGVGGDYISLKHLFVIFGDNIMMKYTCTILYLMSCWLIFFFSSLAYKSHVKEGYLDK